MKNANGFIFFMILAAAMLLGWSGNVAAQVWEEWVARYNGPDSLTDRATCLDLSAEGPIFVSGRSTGATGYDIVTIMYNANGAEQWVDRYDGPVPGNDVANDLIVDEMLDDYSYAYVTGFSEEFQKDFVTLKYNSSGSGFGCSAMTVLLTAMMKPLRLRR
ncbi:MAG TPA: hypothetical protein VF398_08820, partial [bacterium]